MISRFRALLLAVLVLAVVLVAALAVVHLPRFQEWCWDQARAAVERTTGLKIEATSVAIRPWPARLEINGVSIAGGARTFATADRLVATWSWLAVTSPPRSLKQVVLDGARIDLRELPAWEGRTKSSQVAVEADVWRALEIGNLELRGGSVDAMGAGIAIGLRGVAVGGSLVDGRGRLRLFSDEVVAVRDGRSLVLGPVDLRVHGGSDGIWVERSSVSGALLSTAIEGEFSPSTGARFAVEVEADVGRVAGWWDPNVESGFELDGRAKMAGSVNRAPGGILDYRFEHLGGPLRVAGYQVSRLEIEGKGAQFTVSSGDESWGEATVTVNPNDVSASVRATFDRAPVDPLVSMALETTPGFARQPIVASGDLEATVKYPLEIDTLSARTDVRLDWAGGAFEVRGEGQGTRWTVDELKISTPGGELRAAGSLNDLLTVAADLELSLSEPGLVLAEVGRWVSLPASVSLGGGPLEGNVSLSGRLDDPSIEARFSWQAPEVQGVTFGDFVVEAAGSGSDISWNAFINGPSGTTLEMTGTANAVSPELRADWSAVSSDLGAALAAFLIETPVSISGNGRGEGTARWSRQGWDVAGAVEGHSLRLGEWEIDSCRFDFQASPEAVRLDELRAEALSGEVTGSLILPFDFPAGVLHADLLWHSIDMAATPLDLPAAVAGVVDGRLSLAGSPGAPEGESEVVWHGQTPMIQDAAVRIRAALAAGELQVITEQLNSQAGPLTLNAVVPLGAVPRPSWLWPDAPEGAVTAHADGRLAHSFPIAGADTEPPLQVDVAAEVAAELRWGLIDEEDRMARVELTGLRVRYPSGELVARDPVRVNMRDRRIEVERVQMASPHGGIAVEGWYDLDEEWVDGRIEATVAPEISRLIPYPVRMYGPLKITADLEGAVDTLSGAVKVDHSGGIFVLQDPAFEIADLRLDIELFEGRPIISDGSAVVNRGEALLIGGWDPETGQGIVLELDNTTLFVEGILSRWSGLVAVEPDPHRLARISGDLVLEAGVWERSVDVGGALFGHSAEEPAADDPLNDVVLDMSVRGRGGIRVNNNLGRFDVGWESLSIGGTAAKPKIEGDIRIAPGGTINLAGSPVQVQRGVIRFTGDPSVDPVLEIVPLEAYAAYGSDKNEASLDLTTMAYSGLARGVGTALGFENETLQPAEVAVETESTSSSLFLLGRRINRNLAFFFTADLADVQDTTTMLQLWRMPLSPGLALQWYQETQQDSTGINAIQRFRWGGPVAAEDRPEIGRLRFEGEWPIDTRRRKRASGLRRGEPYDPFLLFVAEVRLESELAAVGYQMAEVTSRAGGNARSPTLFFQCEPGPRQTVEFVHADPPKEIRQQVVSLYRPAPLDKVAFRNMRAVLERHYRAEGFSAVEVSVEPRDGVIVADIRMGERTEYQGPALTGVPAAAQDDVEAALGTPRELAMAVTDRERAERIINGILYARGYHQGRVIDVWNETANGREVRVHIDVEPGPRETVSDVVLVGEDPLGLLTAEKPVIRPGWPLDRVELDRAISVLRRRYQEAGYPNVRVRSIPKQREDGSWLIEVHLDAGIRRTVEAIHITGQRFVHDRVLRKGVVLEVGDHLNPTKLDTSAVRIGEFSPVERIDVATRPSGKTGTVIDMMVTEKPRWNADVGVGWNSDTGLEGRFGLGDNSLLGRGVGLNLRGKWNESEQIGLLYASLPHLPGGRLSFLLTLGYRRGDERTEPDIFEQRETTASIEGSLRLKRGTWARAYYQHTRTRTFEKEPDFIFPIDITTTVGTVGLQLILDRFDNPFDPRTGWGFTSDLGWSSSYFGSDLKTLRTVVSGSGVLTPMRGATWVQTLRLADARGIEGTNLDPQLRFFAGGQGSVRGFDRDTVGPVRLGTGQDLVPAGGGALLILNEELRFPVWGALRGAVFTDIGQIWEAWSEAELDLSVGVGLGLRWSTPIGLVWGDVAWPVANRGISSPGAKFYLGIGKPF